MACPPIGSNATACLDAYLAAGNTSLPLLSSSCARQQFYTSSANPEERVAGFPAWSHARRYESSHVIDFLEEGQSRGCSIEGGSGERISRLRKSLGSETGVQTSHSLLEKIELHQNLTFSEATHRARLFKWGESCSIREGKMSSLEIKPKTQKWERCSSVPANISPRPVQGFLAGEKAAEGQSERSSPEKISTHLQGELQMFKDKATKKLDLEGERSNWSPSRSMLSALSDRSNWLSWRGGGMDSCSTLAGCPYTSTRVRRDLHLDDLARCRSAANTEALLHHPALLFQGGAGCQRGSSPTRVFPDERALRRSYCDKLETRMQPSQLRNRILSSNPSERWRSFLKRMNSENSSKSVSPTSRHGKEILQVK